MKKLKRQNGAVTVFLVIILVPCLLVASFFVDMGRVYLSKGMANASAELALNTVMTNYDYDLNDFYGMIASCQTIDEFYDISAEFYFRALQSQKLNDDEIVLLSQSFAELVGDDSIYDYLQVTKKEDTVIAPVANANLENATMLKYQIVDFMKYRAPIAIGTELYDRISGDESIKEVIEAEKNEDLVEEKSEFYEADGELREATYATYHYLKSNYSDKGYTNDELTALYDMLMTDRELYKEIHKVMITNLFNTKDLAKIERKTVALNAKTYTHESPGCNSGTKEVEDKEATKAAQEEAKKKAEEEKNKDSDEEEVEVPEVEPVMKTVHYLESSKFNENVNAVGTAISSFNDAIDDLRDAVNAIPYDSSMTNEIQYWKQVSDILSGANGGKKYADEIETKGISMIDAYAKMLAMDGCEEKESFDYTNFNKYKYEVESLQSKYLTAGVSDSNNDYLKFYQRIEQISANNIDKISADKIILSNGKKINATLDQIATDLDTAIPALEYYENVLDIVINGDGKLIGSKIKSLNKLVDLANSFHTEFGEWKLTAECTQTNMARIDKEGEIPNIENTFANEINDDAVRELKVRLSNMKQQFSSAISLMKKLKYGGKEITSIKNYDTFRKKAATKVEEKNIPLTNNEIEAYVKSTFSELFLPKEEIDRNWKENVNIDNNYNLELNPDTKNVDVPSLYCYLHSQFKDANNDQVQSVQKDRDDAKKKAKEKEDALKQGTGRYHYSDTTDIEKDFSNDKSFNLLTGSISGFVNIIESIYNGELGEIRDGLYLSTYVMNMFSFATFDYDAQYKILDKKSDTDRGFKMTDLKESNYLDKYKTVEEEFNSEELKNAWNKSLTNKVISASNNAAMGAEIEYILYGKHKNKENVAEAYKDIYLIRYGLNYISSFANFWSAGKNTTAGTINAIATAVSGLTSGIVPPQVIKLVLLALLTVFETGSDMDRLAAGFPVELYKTNEDAWHYKLPNLGESSGISDVMASIDSIGEFKNETGKGFFYKDYIMLFVILGFQSNNSEEMTLRLAEVVQANMRKVTNDTTYDMGKAITYFELKSSLKLDPLLLDIPLFVNSTSELGTIGDGWCTYKVDVIRGY